MLQCWESAGGAAGPRARRRGQGCRPCVGLGLQHEAREAIVIDQPGRWGASGAPSAEWGRRRQRDGSIVPGVWAAFLLLLLRAVAATAVAVCINALLALLVLVLFSLAACGLVLAAGVLSAALVRVARLCAVS